MLGFCLFREAFFVCYIFSDSNKCTVVFSDYTIIFSCILVTYMYKFNYISQYNIQCIYICEYT